MTILEALDDPDLFASWFKDRATWTAWRAFLAALFGLPMTDEELALFTACTARQHAPTAAAREAWLIIGRRGGKSFQMALIAVFLAAFKDYRQFLQPGERATILVIAADRKQARVIMRYVLGLLRGVPMLAEMIEGETKERLDLDNSTTIEVSTANFRTVRGYTLAAGICDEIAFWPTDESASPDREVLDALRPAMLTIPTSMLLCASSPYARRGALWDARQKLFGHDGPVLVWQAATRVMNPSIPQEEIDKKYDEDPAVAASEYGALFRTDLQSFVDRETVEVCVDNGVHERLHDRQWGYVAFVDPSGGMVDPMTLAIAHKEGKTVLLDVVREIKPPFSPEQVVEEFADLMKKYRLTKVYGDRYAGEWPREQFRNNGINYEIARKSRSEIYIDVLPLINSTSVSLLENKKLVTQLCSLERRVSTRGKDVIDHPPGGHDDVANAACGALDVAMLTDGRADIDLDQSWQRKKPVFSDPLADYR